MYDTKMSFAHFAHGVYSEGHLFAFMSGPTQPGVRASDILGYFGFGAGNIDGGFISNHFKDFEMVFFDKHKGSQAKRIGDFVFIVNELMSEHGLSSSSVKHAVDLLAVFEQDEDVAPITIGMISELNSSAAPTDLAVCCGVSTTGDRFLGIGLDKRLVLPSTVREYVSNPSGALSMSSINDYDQFNWEFSLPVASVDRGKAYLGNLKRQHFALATLDIQNKMLDRLKSNIVSILTRTPN